MDLRRLALFVAVAEERHFTRAAERLGMAQPPLSQQIRRLEDELGVQLFVRTSRKVELTAAGEQLLTGAHQLFAKRAEVVNLTRRAAAGETGLLRLGIVSSSAFGIVAELIREFHELHPDVTIQLDEPESFDGAASAIIAGQLDVAILRGPFSHPDLRTQLLLRERLYLVIPNNHPLAGEAEVPLSAVADEPFILFPRHTAPRFHDIITGLCVAAGFSPRVGQEGLSWASVVGLVGAGLGVTIAAASAALIKPQRVAFKRIAGAGGEAELLLASRSQSNRPVGDLFISVATQAAGKFSQG